MAAPVTHTLIRIAPFPNEQQRAHDNPLQNHCYRLEFIAKAAITAAVLGFTSYHGYGFFDAAILGNARQCISSGIGLVGGMLVSCFMLSETLATREEASARQHALPV